MKIYYLKALILVLSFSNIQEFPSDFDYKLSDIVRRFKEEIMNKDVCENLKNETNYLVDDINDSLDKEGEYSYDEVLELKKLKKEAEALEEFIASVGDCGNYIPSIKDFNLANQRVNASISYVIKDKYCVDIILVEIGDYITYLAKNNSSKNLTISYKWKVPNGVNRGSGTMGLLKYSVRHIYNNREKLKVKEISIYGINCKEIGF